MEQPMLVVAVAVIGVVEAVAIMAVAVAGPRTLMQVYSVWCTRRRIHVQRPMGR
jgi:ribosomal protein S10